MKTPPLTKPQLAVKLMKENITPHTGGRYHARLAVSLTEFVWDLMKGGAK